MRAADLPDAADGLDVELLRRQDHRRVARVDAGVLDVLDDGRGDDLAPVGDGVHLDLLAVEDELRDDDRVLGRDEGRLLQVPLEVLAR